MKLIHMMGLENGDTMRYMKNRCFTWDFGGSHEASSIPFCWGKGPKIPMDSPNALRF